MAGEIGRLQGVLAGLGRLVDDFVINKGGALCLLPPAFCYPPLPSTIGQTNEEEDECGSSNDGESVSAEEDNEDKGLSSSTGIIVFVDDFVGPPQWNSLRQLNTKIVKNHLATLIPITDITGKRTRQYILNVNYTGNKMMDSHVRFIFETSDARSIEKMEHYCASGSADKDDDTPPLCLFYYGYFLWV